MYMHILWCRIYQFSFCSLNFHGFASAFICLVLCSQGVYVNIDIFKWKFQVLTSQLHPDYPVRHVFNQCSWQFGSHYCTNVKCEQVYTITSSNSVLILERQLQKQRHSFYMTVGRVIDTIQEILVNCNVLIGISSISVFLYVLV